MFKKTFQKMLKLNLILQIMNWIDHYQEEKMEKVIGLMKDELGRKIMTKSAGLKVKPYNQLIDDGNEDKKAKDTKTCVIKKNT